jgi:hemolysin III
MTSEQPSEERIRSSGEEAANCATHGLGLLASLAAVPILIGSARAEGTTWNVVGAGVFGVSMVLLYLASTIYHGLPPGPTKQRFRVLDHNAIYLLIAGTYTPFTLGALRGVWGWTILGLIWGLALAGVAFKTLGGFRFPRASTILYVIMGWLMLIAIRPLIAAVPPAGVGWLVLGGLFYTGGVGFFAARRLRYSHTVWHLFVMAGTICHFFAVLWYSA